MFRLPYADKSFNVVIVSNALHIVPQPEKALAEIRRVLKNDGVLIAPTFTHAENSFTGKVRAFFMKRVGFPLHSKWTSEEYLRFLSQNGWMAVSYTHLDVYKRQALRFVPYEKMEAEGYGYLLYLFEK